MFVGIGATESRFAGIEGEKNSNLHLAIVFQQIKSFKLLTLRYMLVEIVFEMQI